MILVLITNLGGLIIGLVDKLREYFQYVIWLTIGIVVILLAIRVLTDLFKLNPFGRPYQNLRRPTDEMIYRMRSSRFYYPLKKSLGFDPSLIMVLIALAITWYVITSVFSNFLIILQGLGITLNLFGNGNLFSAIRTLIGTILLAVIFFLMALMTIVFVNWIFGLLQRASYWAMDRLAPLLRTFEFGGIFAGWSFVILWIALNLAYFAVVTVFL